MQNLSIIENACSIKNFVVFLAFRSFPHAFFIVIIPATVFIESNSDTGTSGPTRALASSIIGGGGGLIFIYSDSAQLISFQINCFYGV